MTIHAPELVVVAGMVVGVGLCVDVQQADATANPCDNSVQYKVQAPTRTSAYASAYSVHQEGYSNPGTYHAACWVNDNDNTGPGHPKASYPNNEHEGPDCSGFVGKALQIVNGSGYTSDQAFYYTPDRSRQRPVGYTATFHSNPGSNWAWKNVPFADRGIMDAVVWEHVDKSGSWGHVVLVIYPSGDGRTDTVLEARSTNAGSGLWTNTNVYDPSNHVSNSSKVDVRNGWAGV